MARLNLSSPWVLFYHEVDAFFKQDPCVHVMYDDSAANEPVLYIYVDNTYCAGKAEAIEKLLPKFKEYGECKLWISVVPSNGDYNLSKKRYFELADAKYEMLNAAFMSNGAFSYADYISGVFTNPIYYVVFNKEVVQYFTDDLGDINGMRSTLYQEIAKEIFAPMEGVHYCTNTVSDEEML